MTDVLFPIVSADNPEAEGVLATWFVGDGELVAQGDLLAEVAVDKVDVEVPAPVPGTLRRVAEEGDVLHQGAVLGRIS